MTRVRPAVVRFYVDADLVGLGKTLVQLRPDVTYPGDPRGIVHGRVRMPCPITTPATRDDVWIPLVAAEGWLIITRDQHIQSRPAELAAVREHGAKMVNLTAAAAGNTWEQLRVALYQWPAFDVSRRSPARLSIGSLSPAVSASTSRPEGSPRNPAGPAEDSVRGGPSCGSAADPVTGLRDAVRMAYDEELAHRIREQLQDVSGVTEMRMFGGLAFLVNGNMAVAASGQEGGLMLRVPPEQTEALVSEPHAGPMVMRGREMRGWMRVEGAGVEADEGLARWADIGVRYASSLPPK